MDPPAHLFVTLNSYVGDTTKLIAKEIKKSANIVL